MKVAFLGYIGEYDSSEVVSLTMTGVLKLSMASFFIVLLTCN